MDCNELLFVVRALVAALVICAVWIFVLAIKIRRDVKRALDK